MALTPGWSLDLDGNIEARWMVTTLILSGYRTRLTGLLGPLPIERHLVLLVPAVAIRERKLFSFANGKREVIALINALSKARAKGERKPQCLRTALS